MNKTCFFCGILLISTTLLCQPGHAETPPNPSLAAQNPSLNKAIRDWYAAWENKDWDLMRSSLAEGFTFSSPLDDHINIKVFKERCWPNTYKIKRFDLDRVVANGDDVFVITIGWTNDGKMARNCDCFRLKDGKIQGYECFFGPGINYPNSGK